MAKAILFDMDGVVVLNNHFHQTAWINTLEKHNFKVTEDDFYKYVSGRTNESIMNHFFGGMDQSIVDEKEANYREIAKKGNMRAVDGWKKFFAITNKDPSLKTALVTSAPDVNVRFAFDHINVKPRFDTIINGDDVKQGKPNPQCYLMACENLNIEPKDAVVIEDSISGVESAVSAGCNCIAITTTHPPKDLSRATYIAKDYNDIKKQLYPDVG